MHHAQVLDPGFSTNYTERILYATYDVTDMLAEKGAVTKS